MHLLIFGLGYSGMAIAAAAAAAGHAVTGTHREPADATPGFPVVAFAAAGAALSTATHVVSTVPPGEDDPVLRIWGGALREARHLRWVGYLSTTGVYGDRGGAAVDEHSVPAPGQARSRRRLDAEQAWRRVTDGRISLELFRTAGIYGPGRSAFDALRAGRAQRIDRPGHVFGRVHRDDIAGAVLAAALQDRPPGARVLHLSDDLPAEPARVVEEAAALLHVPPPPLIPYEQAALRMTDMARSFWAENRRVDSRLTQQWLRRAWRYPTYFEGLRAILGAQR